MDSTRPPPRPAPDQDVYVVSNATLSTATTPSLGSTTGLLPHAPGSEHALLLHMKLARHLHEKGKAEWRYPPAHKQHRVLVALESTEEDREDGESSEGQ